LSLAIRMRIVRPGHVRLGVFSLQPEWGSALDFKGGGLTFVSKVLSLSPVSAHPEIPFQKTSRCCRSVIPPSRSRCGVRLRGRRRRRATFQGRARVLRKERPPDPHRPSRPSAHSAEKNSSKGGLILDSRDGAYKGGDEGPSVVPGNLEKSLLIKAVQYTDPEFAMPPRRPAASCPTTRSRSSKSGSRWALGCPEAVPPS
jgi:hypothetical protein